MAELTRIAERAGVDTNAVEAVFSRMISSGLFSAEEKPEEGGTVLGLTHDGVTVLLASLTLLGSSAPDAGLQLTDPGDEPNYVWVAALAWTLYDELSHLGERASGPS